MTTTTERVSTADILENGDLPDDVLLGRLVLFTITDEPTPRETLAEWFDDLGLNKDLLPPDTKPIDAFKKATSEASEKYTLPSGETAVVLCRDVETTTKYVKRQITREVRNAAKQTLSYTKAIECTFFRGTSRSAVVDGVRTRVVERGSERVLVRVARDGLDADEIAAVESIATAIKGRFENYYSNLDGNRLRATVRDYLKHLNALEIKAGTYFVPTSKSAELAALQTLVERIGGGCAMYTIPLVDVARQRDMVITAFEREASSTLSEIAEEARTLAAGNATPEAYARVKNRLDDAKAKAAEHLSSLDLSSTATTAATSAAESALKNLAASL